MGRLTKIVLWVFGGFIAVVVALSVFITFFLTEDRLKTLLIPRAEEHLGRNVSIESIKAGLFSGITIKNAVVKEKDSKKNFISVKKFVLSYKLMPLLEKKLVVSEISLVEPEIFVERDKNGHFNFDTLKILESTDAASPKKAPPAPDRAEQAAAIPLALTMDSIQITRAGLEFTDQLNELPSVNGKADLNLKLDMASDMDSLRFNGTLDFFADAVYQGVKTHMSGKSAADQTEISFDMDVDLENEKARVNGRVKNYMKAPDINLDITSQKLDLDHLKSILAGIGAPASAITEKNKDKDKGIKSRGSIADPLPSGLKAAGRISVDETRYNGFLIKDFLVQYKLNKDGLTIDDISGRTTGGQAETRLSLELPEVNGKADVSLDLNMDVDMDSLDFNGTFDFLADAVYQGAKTHMSGKSAADQKEISFDMDVDLENEKARINGRVKNYMKAPDINLDITSQKLDLDHLKSILAGIGAPAAGTTTEKNKDKDQGIEPATPIADALPSGLKAAGRVSVDESKYKGLLIKDFLVHYKLEKGVFTMDELSGRAAGGQVDSRLSLDLNTVMPVYTGSFSVQGLEVVSLAAGIIQKEFNHLSGVLDSEFKYSGKGFALPEIQKTLSLNGDFNLLNGQIKDTFFTRALASVLKIEDLKTLSFEKLGGTVLIKEGVARLNSEMAGTRVSGSAKGDIGLDGRLDLPLVVRLSPELSSRLIERLPLARYLSDDKGFTRLNIKLKGSVDNPRPALDLSAARDKGVEALTNKAAQEIQNALTRGSEEDKSGEAPKDSENQTTETKDPKDQVKDMLKGLFK